MMRTKYLFGVGKRNAVVQIHDETLNGALFMSLRAGDREKDSFRIFLHLSFWDRDWDEIRFRARILYDVRSGSWKAEAYW